jgi:hypothetical protein
MRQISLVVAAVLISGLGLSFVWTSAYFSFIAISWPAAATHGASGGDVPVPVVGYLVFYALLHLGLIPALSTLLVLGIATSVFGVILFKRAR